MSLKDIKTWFVGKHMVEVCLTALGDVGWTSRVLNAGGSSGFMDWLDVTHYIWHRSDERTKSSGTVLTVWDWNLDNDHLTY